MLNESRIPEDYMENAQGCLVPRANIRPIDIERDALVKEKMEKIKALQAEMRTVKTSLLSDMDAFVQLSGERYGVRLGGVKGNVQLLSFDGKYKLCRDYGQLLTFDEGLQAAKELIDGCLRRWCKDSRPELRAEMIDMIHEHGGRNYTIALDPDTLTLFGYIEIDDPEWQEAMKAITESLQVLDSRVYVRAYERDSSGAYQPISLDFANV